MCSCHRSGSYIFISGEVRKEGGREKSEEKGDINNRKHEKGKKNMNRRESRQEEKKAREKVGGRAQEKKINTRKTILRTHYKRCDLSLSSFYLFMDLLLLSSLPLVTITSFYTI